MSTLGSPALPYGLRDVKITPYNADGTLGTSVDLPVMQTLSWSETEEFNDLRGDDQLQATRGRGANVEWDLEAGGISLEALAVLTGATVTNTGTAPSRIKTLAKTSGQVRPYFKIEGQAIGDTGGDVHVVIWRARVNDNVEGEFADGEFFVTSCSGVGLPDATGRVWNIVHNETATAIS